MHKRGDIREDGKVFMHYYQKGGQRREYWLPAEEFKLRMEAVAAYRRARYLGNREAFIAEQRRREALDPEKSRARRRAHYANNREKYVKMAAERKRRRLATDPVFRLEHIMRARVYCALREAKVNKAGRFHELIGTDAATLRQHLEAQFSPGMTWDNHGLGKGKWHVDHIRPCISFDLRDPAQQAACFHYTNLQPLWSEDNLRKGGRH